MKLMKSKHAVYEIGYHFVFCTKFRHKIFEGCIEPEVTKILGQTCANYNWIVKSIEVMPDHVHLYIQTDHTYAPVTIAQILKSVSAVYIFTKFPNIKQEKFWGSGLWSSSTYYGTVGKITEDKIINYIQSQKLKKEDRVSSI